MMFFRRISFFVFLLLGFFRAEISFSQIRVFQTVWGEDVASLALDNQLANRGYSVCQSSDGGYLVFGATASSNRIMVSKMNTDGSWQWTKKWDGGNAVYNSVTYSVAQATDGGYAFVGTTQYLGNTSATNMMLTKVDGTGATLQWSYAFGNTAGTSNTEDGFNIRVTPDGGYLLVGRTEGYGYDSNCGSSPCKYDFYIAKTNNLGVLQWNLAWGGSVHDYAYDACVSYSAGTTQDGYLIVGESSSFPSSFSSSNNIPVLKINTDGTYAWSKVFDISKANGDADHAYSCVQSTSGSYIIAGETIDIGGTNTQKMFLMSISLTGALEWTKTYDGAYFGRDWSVGGNKLLKTTDGGYIMAGVTNAAPYNALLIKTTSNGTVSWSKTYAGTNWAGSVQQTSDGGYVFSATTRGSGSDLTRQFSLLIKTNTGGVTTAACVATAAGMSAVSVTPSTTVVPTYTLTSPAGTSYALTLGTQVKTYTTVTTCTAVLPVVLLSLNGECNNQIINLNWSTASELNNNYFTIERSSTGTEWESVGTVQGAGNSSSVKNYEFVDESPPSTGQPIIYYRLKQTDYNGHYEYFGPISVSCSSANELTLLLQGTPSEYVLGTLISPEDQNMILEIIDLQGRKILSRQLFVSKGSNLLREPLKNIQSGVYFIRVYNRTGQVQKKFVKLN